LHSFLVVHLLLCFIYAIFMYKKRGQQAVYCFVVVFLMPIAGFFFLFILNMLKSSGRDIDFGIFNTDEAAFIPNIGFVKMVDYEREVNIVPIEEALLINSDDVKRKLIIDIFKEDAVSYIDFLEKALNNRDTETSHYAAAAVSDIYRKFSLELQSFSVKYEMDRSNTDVLIPYAKVLKGYLSSTLLDKKSQRKYKYAYSQVMADLLLVNPKEEYFMEKINCDINLKEFDQARHYCETFLSMYRSIEAPYLMFLKYYYIMKDNSGFYKMLSDLKSSSARFSNKGLSIVRHWSECTYEYQ